MARLIARSRLTLNVGVLAVLAALVAVLGFPRVASAAPVGTFKLKNNEVTEVSGAWHLYVTIELPKAPPTAHQPMRFLFTKTMVYERALIDGHAEPVLNRQALQNQSPSVESLDIDFADPSGKIFKGTRFDFGLTRTRGYEAGEYTVELRTSEGYTVGGKANLILKGDNPPVDRRAMAFSAKGKDIKKVDAYDAGANQAKNDDPAPQSAGGGPGEVTPMGTATGFVPKEGMEETEEEKIKTRPRGCGCEVPGQRGPGTALLFLLPIAGIGIVSARRRAARRARS
jgi:hypothetical protein